jgi:NAD+ diphosphatase
MQAPESRYLLFWKLQALIKTEEPAIAWANADILDAMVEGSGPVLLGLEDEVAHFAVDVSGLEKPERELGLTGAATFSDVRMAAGQVPDGESALLAQGRALVDWHATHRFCAQCGEPTRLADAGYMRICEDCDAQHFPRTNPVVIMLVHRSDRCLLGRGSGWPAGMFSALAGFIEPGETIEEAVRREVMEETSIQVGDVSYLASQPWPFPSSLMIGCLGQGLSEEIHLGDDELEEARWIEREQIVAAIEAGGGSGGFFVPPPMAIAHQLIRAWALGA